MSKSPNVLVAVGQTQNNMGYVPQQTYRNLFTEFNLDTAISFDNDADFYNTKIRTPSTQGKSDFDIYGFVPGNYSYTYDDSIQTIVEFFQQDSQIDIVICDLLFIRPNFTSYTYIHPQSENNIPFFINSSIVNKIRFVNEPQLMQKQLRELQQQGHIIFHIALPLISIHSDPAQTISRS
tara:strand:+ start:1402 stop:1938 length:537 start_codon:yes stop_codon:yes gene_type:complete